MKTFRILISTLLALMIISGVVPSAYDANAETGVLSEMDVPQPKSDEGDVWWKYDSRNKILYISDEESKGDDYVLFSAEDQKAAQISADERYGWILSCEDAVKAVIQGTPSPAETKYWFHRMSSLESIENLAKLDTSKVTTMHFMFGICRSLEELDLSGFNTANVETMANMFYECAGLEELDLSRFDTSKVTNMNSMFNQCTSLTSVNLSGLKTAEVTDMSNMFYHCDVLKSVDISSFDVSKVNTMTWMFNTCGSLETIYAKAGTDWSDTSINMDNMFVGCNSLVGGKGTVYDPSYHPKEYARVDDPDKGKPGYFTAAVPETFEVSFNANGHGTAPGSQMVDSGGKVTEPVPAPQEDGWIFDGWYENAECTGEAYDFDTPVTGKLELFAKWTRKTDPDDPIHHDTEEWTAPNTADRSQMGMWITAMSLSLLTAAVLYKKKSD